MPPRRNTTLSLACSSSHKGDGKACDRVPFLHTSDKDRGETDSGDADDDNSHDGDYVYKGMADDSDDSRHGASDDSGGRPTTVGTAQTQHGKGPAKVVDRHNLKLQLDLQARFTGEHHCVSFKRLLDSVERLIEDHGLEALLSGLSSDDQQAVKVAVSTAKNRWTLWLAGGTLKLFYILHRQLVEAIQQQQQKPRPVSQSQTVTLMLRLVDKHDPGWNRPAADPIDDVGPSGVGRRSTALRRASEPTRSSSLVPFSPYGRNQSAASRRRHSQPSQASQSSPQASPPPPPRPANIKLRLRKPSDHLLSPPRDQHEIQPQLPPQVQPQSQPQLPPSPVHDPPTVPHVLPPLPGPGSSKVPPREMSLHEAVKIGHRRRSPVHNSPSAASVGVQHSPTSSPPLPTGRRTAKLAKADRRKDPPHPRSKVTKKAQRARHTDHVVHSAAPHGIHSPVIAETAAPHGMHLLQQPMGMALAMPTMNVALNMAATPLEQWMSRPGHGHYTAYATDRTALPTPALGRPHADPFMSVFDPLNTLNTLTSLMMPTNGLQLACNGTGSASTVAVRSTPSMPTAMNPVAIHGEDTMLDAAYLNFSGEDAGILSGDLKL
ncbi:hypothetical protein BC831DRAFT_450889 [Entophlyctis helioformis]|nr:hypothetical protein BC831DRAFT_450889 [Entophlyctis helioformis]